jgi:hypothetical protein
MTSSSRRVRYWTPGLIERLLGPMDAIVVDA